MELDFPLPNIPERLKCSQCAQLARDAWKLACCDGIVCGACFDKLPSSACPICAESPLDKAGSDPSSSLRTTILVFLRHAEKRHNDAQRAQIKRMAKERVEDYSDSATPYHSFPMTKIVDGLMCLEQDVPNAQTRVGGQPGAATERTQQPGNAYSAVAMQPKEVPTGPRNMGPAEHRAIHRTASDMTEPERRGRSLSRTPAPDFDRADRGHRRSRSASRSRSRSPSRSRAHARPSMRERSRTPPRRSRQHSKSRSRSASRSPGRRRRARSRSRSRSRSRQRSRSPRRRRSRSRSASRSHHKRRHHRSRRHRSRSRSRSRSFSRSRSPERRSARRRSRSPSPRRSPGHTKSNRMDAPLLGRSNRGHDASKNVFEEQSSRRTQPRERRRSKSRDRGRGDRDARRLRDRSRDRRARSKERRSRSPRRSRSRSKSPARRRASGAKQEVRQGEFRVRSALTEEEIQTLEREREEGRW